VSRLTPSAHDPGRVYATFDGHRNGDYAPYVYVTEDFGERWRRIDDGLPYGWSVNVITEHHRAPDLLFVGNEVGVYVSIDRGERWTRLVGNLPTVPVDDIVIHPRENDLIVGTHGRSVWIMADVAPLEHLAEDVMVRAGHLFPSRSTIMWAQKGDWPFYGWDYFAPNPPRATPIRYWLREAGDSVTLTLADAAGERVRTLTGPGDEGINEVLWDWRHDRPYEPSDGGDRGGGGGGGGAAAGPVALPGTYTVTMDVGSQISTEQVTIEADPRRPMTPADRMARQDALMSLRELAAPLYEARQAVERLAEQMDAAEALLEGHDGPVESLTEELETIQTELEEILDGLDEARRWTGVAGAIQQSSTLPTEDQLWQVDAAWDAAAPLVERINALITLRVPALNDALDAEGVRPHPGEALVVPRRGG
jgi:hypothetical protein